MSEIKNPTVVILHNKVDRNSTQDELDVIAQVNSVSQALVELGYKTIPLPLSLNLREGLDHLQSLKPAFVFNLVESIDGTGRFIYFASAMLDQLQLPFSGAGTDALYITTNKLLSKRWLKVHGIATPSWIPMDGSSRKIPDFDPPYILKPVWEDASVGLDDNSVFFTKKAFRKRIDNQLKSMGEWFAEAYIPGREFNISILAGDEIPQILPIAEIDFVGYPSGKPRIVDYRAKWDVDSFEYHHTVRRFDFSDSDEKLFMELRDISLRCWQIFDLHGYARVDFRVDRNRKPWVLEINANPCISPDSGYVAAAGQAGLDFKTVVYRIINDIPKFRHDPVH